jgi:hypothetical protein
MRSTPTRTLAALYERGEELAYERGQEFDPSLWLSPALCDQLAAAGRACRPVAAPSAYERRRRRERQRREACARVPGWFSPGDLVEPALTDGRLIHGELV